MTSDLDKVIDFVLDHRFPFVIIQSWGFLYCCSPIEKDFQHLCLLSEIRTSIDRQWENKVLYLAAEELMIVHFKVMATRSFISFHF